MRLAIRHLAILLGSFAGVTALAAVAGAANLGTAATIGQIAFVIALVVLLVAEGRSR